RVRLLDQAFELVPAPAVGRRRHQQLGYRGEGRRLPLIGELGILEGLAELVQLIVVDGKTVGGELPEGAHVFLDESVAQEQLLPLRLPLARLAVELWPL